MNRFMDQAQRLTEMWGELATKMTAAGISATAAVSDPETTPPEAGRTARSAVFDALSQQADQYMRSPQFLQWMKESMDRSIHFQEQLNTFFTKLHHDVQSVARQDVDELLRSIRHLEQRVNDAADRVLRCVDGLEKRLAALEEPRKKPSRKPGAKTRRNAKAKGASHE